MCGIAGFYNSKVSLGEGKSIIQTMTSAIQHRGPDDGGIWASRDGLYLGHRRLAIIDISSAGAQPMVSKSKKSVIVFNGEIYNFKIIQKKLLDDGFQFRGHSDTEVLLESIEHFGIEWTLQQIEGMFAFAYYDIKNKNLLLARDRLGEKPLYYLNNEKMIGFASELKSLIVNPETSKELDFSAISLYFKFNYIPSPKSIFKDIKKLNPGEYISFNLSNMSVLEHKKYWSYLDGLKQPKLNLSESDIVSKFESLFVEKIKDQMISDVPIGAFLSGGVDSTAVVAAMSQVSTSKVKTFTIGFKEKEYDESAYAKRIASHLGVEHTDRIIDANMILDLVPQISHIYDEPFSDSSQMPTYLLSSLTRKKVTVSLSGDGGDELLGGYSRYQWAKTISNVFKFMPLCSRRIIKKIILSIAPNSLNWIGFGQSHFGEKLHKLARYLDSRDKYELYAKLCSHWYYAEPLINKEITESEFDRNMSLIKSSDFLSDMMTLDSMHYLPDDIMTKVDRASMAVSLETRAPFLNHKLIEFAQSVPSEYKIRKGESKWLLRNYIDKHVPREYMEFPKKGFSVPLDHWFRKELKNWVCDSLSDSQTAKHGLFDKKVVNKVLSEHMSGQMNWQYHIWDLLVFQEWYNTWIYSKPTTYINQSPLKDYTNNELL